MSAPIDSPSRALGGDHDALDHLFEEFRGTPLSEIARRRALLHQFTSELRRHIAVEESRLYPPFEASGVLERQLVTRMRDEHRRIESTLHALEHRVDGVGAGKTDDLEEELLNVLWAHNALEELEVYPWFDSHLSPDEVRAVLDDLHGPVESPR